MRPERVWVWLPLLGLAACSPGIVVLSASTHCWGLPWVCQPWPLSLNRLASILFVLLPWVVLVACGMRAGVRQLTRTRQAVRRLFDWPRVRLPVPLAGLARDLEIADRLDVVDCCSAEAFCYGLFAPRICVTTGLLHILSRAEIEAVLRHERHHLQRYDPLRALIWTVLDGSCWWVKDGGAQARLRRELAADRAVIAAGGRLPLASALLKLLAQPGGDTIAARNLAISGLSVTGARIEQLLRPDQALPWPRPHYHWLVLPALIGLTMLLCAR